MQLLKHSFAVKCENRFLHYALVSLICLFPCPVQAQSDAGIRIIDESAINYLEFLSKADFDQRFPGQIKSDSADLESGWYVIYAHQDLNYYFGPILLESTGQDYLTQLTQIVDAAVGQRPSIEGYQLGLSYEPSGDSSGSSRSSGSSGDDPDGSGVGDEQQPGAPLPPSGFWGFIRRVFGV
ncbi:MAG: hypothetical protein ACJAT5_000662 [Lentimonas sp.]|jgi:hypothetical protein